MTSARVSPVTVSNKAYDFFALTITEIKKDLVNVNFILQMLVCLVGDTNLAVKMVTLAGVYHRMHPFLNVQKIKELFLHVYSSWGFFL